MKILEEIIKNTKPPVPLQELKKYEIIKAKMDGENIEELALIDFAIQTINADEKFE